MNGAGPPEDWYMPAMFCYFFLTLIVFVNIKYISTTLRKKLYPAGKKKKKAGKKGAVTPSKGSQGTTNLTSNGLGLSSASTTKNSSRRGTNTNMSSGKLSGGSSNVVSNQMSGGISSASSSLQSGVIQSGVSSSVIEQNESSLGFGRHSSTDYR